MMHVLTALQVRFQLLTVAPVLPRIAVQPDSTFQKADKVARATRVRKGGTQHRHLRLAVRVHRGRLRTLPYRRAVLTAMLGLTHLLGLLFVNRALRARTFLVMARAQRIVLVALLVKAITIWPRQLLAKYAKVATLLTRLRPLAPVMSARREPTKN